MNSQSLLQHNTYTYIYKTKYIYTIKNTIKYNYFLRRKIANHVSIKSCLCKQLFHPVGKLQNSLK